MRRPLALFVAVFVLAGAPEGTAAPLTGDDLLARLTDPVAATRPLPAGARIVQRSSHEREGGNRDWGVWSAASGRPQTYVRREGAAAVLLDERRPGCLTRMWFTAGAVLGDISGAGRLQLFFDGEASPRVDVPAADFFAGRSPGFPQPLVGDAESSSGGFHSYVPFCFARSLKVRVTRVPEGEQLWYQLTTLALPYDTPVETYRPGDLDTARAETALRTQPAPPAGQDVTAAKLLTPGTTLPLVTRSGAGSIRLMRFTVTPFTPDALAGLELRITANGAKAPQVAVPLGALLGDGLSARAVQARAFGMDPVAGTGYFALPAPYTNGVTVDLRSATTANVQVRTRLGPPIPDAIGVLAGKRTVERSRPGTDFTALAASGSGRVAAWVLDLTGPPGGGSVGPLQYFLEGDERVLVDGSRPPSIYGTGTEDAFNGGFYYVRGQFSRPTHGAGTFLPGPDGRGQRSQYRMFGADGFLFEDGIRFGMEHGGGDEHAGEVTASTVFWYAAPRRLTRTDALKPADRRSATTHRLQGSVTGARLTAYFEGDRDGNGVVSSTTAFGGQDYPAPPPSRSPEGVTATGIAFAKPVAFDVRLAARNCGAILRRLLDAATPSSVDVAVDGGAVGFWSIAEANPAKRWLEDDFELSARLTRGKRSVRVSMTPAKGTTATAYALTVLSRTRC